jgi:hypothetical protein
MLDDILLPDDDYSVMVEHTALMAKSKNLLAGGMSEKDLATRLAQPRSRRALEILQRLTQAMHERKARVDQLLKRRD